MSAATACVAFRLSDDGESVEADEAVDAVGEEETIVVVVVAIVE